MLPAALEAVLFDVGGTLVSLDYGFVAEVSAAQGAGVPVVALQRGEVAARRALDACARATGTLEGTDAGRLRGYFANLLAAAGVPEPALARVLDVLEREHAERNLWRQPARSAAPTLATLRGHGLRTAVVSNADGRARSLLGALGLAGELDLILDSRIEGVEKPDPEIFRRALARLRVEAERAAYIGDIYSIDAVGARAAGIAPVLVDPTGTYGRHDCPVVADLGELPDLLLAGRKRTRRGA